MSHESAPIAGMSTTGRETTGREMTGPEMTGRETTGPLGGVGGDALPTGVLWRRLLARLVDAAAVLAVLWMLVVLQIFWFMGDATRRLDPEPWGSAFVPLAAFVVLSGAYEVVFLRFNGGQTPGKDLLNLRVVARSTDGPGLSLPRALLRWLLPGLLLLAWPLWLGALAVVGTAITTPLGTRPRAAHDHLAGTEVVHYRHADHVGQDAGKPDRTRGRDGDRRHTSGQVPPA